MAAEAGTTKVSVTLPKRLVDEARTIAAKGEMSALLAEALERYLAHRRQMAALEIGFGAWKDENHPELQTPQDTAAYIRSIREADQGRLEGLTGKADPDA